MFCYDQLTSPPREQREKDMGGGALPALCHVLGKLARLHIQDYSIRSKSKLCYLGGLAHPHHCARL